MHRWRHVVTLEPNNIEALLNLAHIEFDSSDMTQALWALQRILNLYPDHKDALYKTAAIYYRTENYEESVLVAERLVRIDSGYLNIRSLLQSARSKIKQETTL